MPVWLLPLLLAAVGGAAGQAKTHHTKGTLEGAGLGALAGMGLGGALGAGGAGAGAAGTSAAEGSAAMGSGLASDTALAASGSPFAGIGSMVGGATDAGMASAVPAASNAALATASPSLWSQLGMAGAKGAAGTGASMAAQDLATPKQRVTTPSDIPFGQLPNAPQFNQLQLPSYEQQLRQLGFA